MDIEKVFEGKTVDKAIEEACNYFNCQKDALEIEVITKGSTGIFGIGGRKAQIRVRYKDELSLSDDEGYQASKEEMSEEGEEGVKVRDDDKRDEDRENHSVDKEIPSSVCLDEAKEVLERLIGLSGINCSVRVIATQSNNGGNANNVPYLDIDSPELALIIGKNGHTLSSYRYVMNLIMKKRRSDCPPIEVDAEGYLEKRKISVENTAKRMAEKAKRIGRSVSLDPMNAKDRRLVHLAVKRIRGVTTKSIGEGPDRRVIIVPHRGRGGHDRGGNRIDRDAGRRGIGRGYPRGRRY